MVWGIIAAVIAVVASAGVYYQQKKMEAQAAKQAQEAKAVQVSGHDSNRGLYTVYGQTLVGSTIVWKHVSDKEARITQSGFTTISAATGSELTTNKDHKNNRWLYRAVTLCNGPVTDITNVTIDDEGYRSPRFTNKTNKHFATTYSVGPTAGQNFSALRSAYSSDFYGWASDAAGKGVAYAMERLYLHKDKPAYQGEPQTRYRVKGRALYDPRKDSTSSAYNSNLGTSSHRADTATTWEYSDNPVLALLDYMRSEEYGRGLDLAVIDIDSIATSADKCDVLVDIPHRLANDTGSVVTYYDPETGETYIVTVNGDYPYYRADQQTTGTNANKQRRFRINMAVDPSKEILDNIQEILNVFRGNLSYANGTYFVHMADVASPVLTLNDDDIIGGLKIANGDRSQRMNRATVKFINQAKQYKTDQVSWPSLDSNEDGGLYATYLTQDEDEKLHRTFTIKGCTDFYQAQDTAEFLVRDSRSNLSVSGTFGSRCFGLIPGDVVALDYDSSGFSGKYFRVIQTQVDLVSMNVGLQLKEYDSSVYTWNTNRGNEPLGLSWQEEVVNADPTNLTIGTIATNTTTRSDGSASQTLTIPFSEVPEAAQYVEIGVAINNTTEYETHLVFDTENQTQAEIPIARDNQTYAVRARYFATNSYGTLMPSAYTETTHTVASLSGTKLDGIESGATQNTGALADLDTVSADEIDDQAVTIAKLDTSLQSTNYQAGVSGWKLTKAGVFEAGSGTFRGALTATSLDVQNATVTGTLSANNIAIDGVTLDTNSSGEIIIKDGGVGNSQMGADSVAARNIIEGSVSKVNPVTQSQNVYRWGGFDDAGNVVNAVPSGITLEYDATEQALELRNDGNVGMRSDTFVIDQNSIYKVSMTIKKTGGSWYVGLFQNTSFVQGVVSDGGNVQTQVNFTLYSGADRTETTSTNAYFATGSGPAVTSYTNFVFYILGANVDIDEVPQASITYGHPYLKVAGDAYKHVGLRILNWSNGGTPNSLFVKDLSVVEMTATTIIAENISTTNLAAINSNLGAIDAGSIDIGGGNFTVSTAGAMTATGATISGGITATSLTLDSSVSIASGNLDSTVVSGAAAGATANQDATSTILGGNHTGTVNNVAASTVTSGAAAGATALQISDISEIISEGNIPTGKLTLNSSGSKTVTLNGNNFTSSGGTDNTWDTHVYSSEHYTSPLVLQFEVGTTGLRYMVGLNEDPTINTSYSSIDYAFYQAENSFTIYESGYQQTPNGGAFTYATGDKLSIVYDGTNVYYYHNETLKRTVSNVGTKDFYFDSSLYDNNQMSINDIRFAPIANIDYGSVGGISIEPNRLYAGTGTWANSNTGFYLDNTGKFSLKDKMFFNPANNTLTVDGNITADVITAKQNLVVLGDLQASSVAVGSITRAMLSQDALDEIFGSLASSVGGSNGDFKEGSGTFTTSGGSVTLGTSSDKFDHGVSNVDVEFNINTFFYTTTNYTQAQAQATLTFEATADGTFNDLNSADKTHTLQFNEYDLSSYYGYTYLVYHINTAITKTFTSGSGSDLTDNVDVQFRVAVSGVGSAFTGQTVPFDVAANEGVTGVTSTGGNADTLDNLDSTAFLRSNVDDTFDGDLTITGQLILNGSIDQYNVTDLDVTDKTITVNSGNTQSLSDGAGLIVDRGTADDASFLWDETHDEFDISNSVKITGSLGVTNIVTNKVVKYNGTILDDSNITDTGSLITLGSATTVSSDLSVTGDLKMAGSDSYIWTPDTTTGFTGFWDSSNSRIAARYRNDFGGWGILGDPESGTELKVHGKIKATDFQVFKQTAAGGGNNKTNNWNQVHAAISDNSGASTYIILDTAVPQDNHSMGGFTLICFNEYDDHSEGDVVHIYGYFTSEANGGFGGFRYVCSNPDFEPTIQVARNSSGNTAFLISGFDDTRYTVMVAKDLYLGYLASNAAASWGDGWAFSQASSTSGYTNLDTLERIGITDTQISNIATAYNYSQVGHLPLSGGTLTGSLTAGNTIVGAGGNISMDASANGHLEINGSAYTGAIALDGNDMHFYHNSAERGIVFGTNETNRVKITSSGQLETYYDLNSYQAQKWYVSTADSAHQRMDVRDEGIESRAHWYGVRSNAATSNFRHAWYDGNNYINVTASNNQVLFQPDGTQSISLNLNSTSTSSNPAFLLLGGKNSSSQDFRLEIANRGAHNTAAFADKIDFSVYNNGTYYYSALRFDLYGGVETKQHIGNAASPYASDDRYFKFTNDVAGKSGTLVTADNGNTWLNADGGRDLWLNWYSLNSPTSRANVQVGDGYGGSAILAVVGADRRVGILDTSPEYPLDVTGDIRSTGTVRADSGINVHSGRILTASSNQTGGGNVETYFRPDGNDNHQWRLIAGGTNTGYGTGAGGLGFYYTSSVSGSNADYNLILNADQTSTFKGKVTISHSNFGAEPYVGLEVKNPSSSGDRLTGIAVNAAVQSHYRYMLGGVTKWQSRVGGGAAIDDWRLYSWTTASDILTVKPEGEGELRLFKTGSGTQWADTSGTGSISINGYGSKSSSSNPTVAFSAGAGGYAMFYLNRMIDGSETFSDSSARYFDFYRQGASKVRMVTSAADEFGFYMAGSGSFNVWNSGGTNTVSVANSGTTTLYALNVSNSAQVGGSNIFHAGYSNTWAQIPAGTRTNYTLRFKPPQNNYAGFAFDDEDATHAGYLLIRGGTDAAPTYKANGISLIADAGWLTLAQRTTTSSGIRFVTQNTTNVGERAQFSAGGNFLVGTAAEGGLSVNSGSIRAAGTIDTGVGGSAAFRLYDGTTFKGGFGSSQWATGDSSNPHVALFTNTNKSLEIYTGGTVSAGSSRMTFEADGTIDNPSAKWARTYHQVSAYASGGTDYDVHTHWGVLCAGSDSSSPLAYTVIDTNINQDQYRMGGFTLLVMDNYGSAGGNSGNQARTRARIDLAGYWNPENNGGFLGWNYTTTNPRERPEIYVMRNSTTGKVAFAYKHSAVVGASYPIVVACDLWTGFANSAEADGKNWGIKQQSDLSGYTNSDQVNYVGGNGNYQNSDGSFVISKSSGTMFSHGSFTDAIGYNGSYGTYIGGGGRYVYSGGSGTGNSGTHPYYSDGAGQHNILHNGGQIANTFNGDHTFTNATSSGGIKVTNDQSGGPAIKIHSTNTNGTDWWLISNSSSNTNGAGKLQLWSNNNSFTAATFGETANNLTSLYTPTRIHASTSTNFPTFTSHTSGSTTPTLVANANGQNAHALVVNQPVASHWAQIISTQRYGLLIDSHASDSTTYLLQASIAGIAHFFVKGNGVVHHRGTTEHGVQGAVQGHASYAANSSDGANIDYYSPNGAQAHMDCRNSGNHSMLHKYTYDGIHGYGQYQENWWDGDSYHQIGSISNAIRTNGDFVATGNVTAYGTYSDRRLKENIRPFESARDLIRDVNVHRFNYIGKDDDLIGVIAQEVEETLPELVYELIDTDSNEVRKAVRYEHLAAVLLGVVKEQEQELKEIKSLVESLLEKIK